MKKELLVEQNIIPDAKYGFWILKDGTFFPINTKYDHIKELYKLYYDIHPEQKNNVSLSYDDGYELGMVRVVYNTTAKSDNIEVSFCKFKSSKQALKSLLRLIATERNILYVYLDIHNYKTKTHAISDRFSRSNAINLIREVLSSETINETTNIPISSYGYWITPNGEYVAVNSSQGHDRILKKILNADVFYTDALIKGYIRVVYDSARNSPSFDANFNRTAPKKALIALRNLILWGKDIEYVYLDSSLTKISRMTKQEALQELTRLQSFKINEASLVSYGFWITNEGKIIDASRHGHENTFKSITGMNEYTGTKEVYKAAYEEGWIRVVHPNHEVNTYKINSSISIEFNPKTVAKKAISGLKYYVIKYVNDEVAFIDYSNDKGVVKSAAQTKNKKDLLTFIKKLESENINENSGEYGYWIEPNGAIHPVDVKQGHAFAAAKLLKLKTSLFSLKVFDNNNIALDKGWIRIAIFQNIFNVELNMEKIAAPVLKALMRLIATGQYKRFIISIHDNYDNIPSVYQSDNRHEMTNFIRNLIAKIQPINENKKVPYRWIRYWVDNKGNIINVSLEGHEVYAAKKFNINLGNKKNKKFRDAYTTAFNHNWIRIAIIDENFEIEGTLPNASPATKKAIAALLAKFKDIDITIILYNKDGHYTGYYHCNYNLVMKNLQPTIKEDMNQYGYWILPNGKLLPVPRMDHYNAIIKAMPEVANVVDPKQRMLDNSERVYNTAFNLGCVRLINYEDSIGINFRKNKISDQTFRALINFVKSINATKYFIDEFDTNFFARKESARDVILTLNKLYKNVPIQRLEESTDIPESSYGYWIDPNGKFYSVSFENHVGVVKQYINKPSYTEAYKLGWIKIYGTTTSPYISIAINKLNVSKKSIKSLFQFLNISISESVTYELLLIDDTTNDISYYNTNVPSKQAIKEIRQKLLPINESYNDNRYGFWIDGNGNLIDVKSAGQHYTIARKIFDKETALELKVSEDVYNYIYKKGWIRIVNIDSGPYIDIDFNEKYVSRNALKTLLRVVSSNRLIKVAHFEVLYNDKPPMLSHGSAIEQKHNIIDFIKSFLNKNSSIFTEEEKRPYGYWIDPTGKIFSVKYQEHISTYNKITKSDVISYKEPFLKGWIRIVSYYKGSLHVEFNVDTTSVQSLHKVINFAQNSTINELFIDFYTIHSTERHYKTYDNFNKFIDFINLIISIKNKNDDTNLLPILLKESSVIYGYWIDDHGNFHEVEEGQHVQKAIELLHPEPNVHDIYKFAQSKGWIRVVLGEYDGSINLQFFQKTVSGKALEGSIKLINKYRITSNIICDILSNNGNWMYKRFNKNSYITMCNEIKQKSYLKESIVWQSYWINPTGNFIDVSEMGHITYINKLGIDTYEDAYKRGWIRVLEYNNELNVEISVKVDKPDKSYTTLISLAKHLSSFIIYNVDSEEEFYYSNRRRFAEVINRIKNHMALISEEDMMR